MLYGNRCVHVRKKIKKITTKIPKKNSKAFNLNPKMKYRYFFPFFFGIFLLPIVFNDSNIVLDALWFFFSSLLLVFFSVMFHFSILSGGLIYIIISVSILFLLKSNFSFSQPFYAFVELEREWKLRRLISMEIWW